MNYKTVREQNYKITYSINGQDNTTTVKNK